MDIKTFKMVATQLPPEMAVLMRGPTGVGKSHLAKQCADEIGLPFIDVRGSTMSEGDVGGYPDIEGMKETGVMTFCMPSWFMRATREPVVLHWKGSSGIGPRDILLKGARAIGLGLGLGLERRAARHNTA